MDPPFALPIAVAGITLNALFTPTDIRGLTNITTLHVQEEALEVADRVVVMNEGGPDRGRTEPGTLP